jgi:hypothetical protein
MRSSPSLRVRLLSSIPFRLAALLAGLALPSFIPVDPALADTQPPADMRFTGESGGSEDLFGWSAAAAGDVNGDGFPDLVIGAPSSDELQGFAGRAYLFYGPFTGDRTAANADATISAVNFGDNLGIAVDGAGDLNGDGNDDLVVGARSNDAAGTQAGQVYVFHGPLAGNLTPAQASGVISGEAFEELGIAVAGVGDVNGDGRDDLLLGAHQFNAGVGRAYLFHGPVTGSRTSGSANAIITGEFSSDHFGTALAAGDIDGDGRSDVVIGAPHGPIDFLDPGRAYLFHGPVSGTLSAAAADVVFHGEDLNDLFGSDVSVGDVNGDDFDDVVVSANQLFNGDQPGKAYVFYGPFNQRTIQVLAANADGRFTGEGPNDVFGDAVAAIPDVNGDGRDEVLVGAWDNQVGGFRVGRGYLFLGPAAGVIPASAADLIITGEESGDRLGKEVAAAGDLDMNGLGDLLVGAPEFPTGDPGKAFVYLDGAITTAIDAAHAPAAELKVLASTPNPFGDHTTLRYNLERADAVALRIYDARGALVRVLFAGREEAGPHAVHWDGRNAQGARLPSGVFFAELTSGSETRRQSLIILR